MAAYRVDLDIFSGPLDLLLYLVKKDEVDIYDISITKITDQYLRYLDMLRQLDIELAGDFLVLAATLMQIKSQMLLPKDDLDGADDEDTDADPRAELIRQLLEYKRFKDAANQLDEAQQAQSQRHGRPDTVIEQLKQDSEPELDLDQISTWDLLEAFDNLLKATGSYADYSHITDETPIDIYQIEILDRLQREGPMTFARLFQSGTNRAELVGMFLALLELLREGLAWAQQEQGQSGIYVRSLTDEPAEKAVREAIYSRQDEYDGQADKPPIPIEEIPADSGRKSKTSDVETQDDEQIPNESI